MIKKYSFGKEFNNPDNRIEISVNKDKKVTISKDKIQIVGMEIL